MKLWQDTSLTAQQRAEALTDELTVKEMAEQLRYDAPAVERLGIPFGIAFLWDWNEN